MAKNSAPVGDSKPCVELLQAILGETTDDPHLVALIISNSDDGSFRVEIASCITRPHAEAIAQHILRQLAEETAPENTDCPCCTARHAAVQDAIKALDQPSQQSADQD